MKTKLLKKVRRKYKLRYYPKSKTYMVKTFYNEFTYNNIEAALFTRNTFISRYIFDKRKKHEKHINL